MSPVPLLPRLFLLGLPLAGIFLGGCASDPARQKTGASATARAGAATPTASAPPAPFSTPGGAATPASLSYTVQAGDSLASIAQRYHTTVAALHEANGITGDTIHVGQVLAVPAPMATVTVVARTRPQPSDTSPAVVLSRGRTDTNSVALTFDAGSDVGFTKLILDTLKRDGVHASFGMTGQWAQQNPDLVRQMAADGHEFINHTWSHSSFTGLSFNVIVSGREQRWSELDRTDDIIYQLTGRTTLPFFRAPFGDEDRSVEIDAGLRGYRYDVLWTVDTRGWAKASVGQIVAACRTGAVPGAIIVMHVGSDSQDGPALQSVIDAIRQKGLDFATISQIAGPR